jgi:integrase/recombinase XerD
MVKLSAVPDQPAHGLGDVPADWPDLRASFVLALRAARRSPATIRTYLEGCDAFAVFLAERSPGRLVEQATRDDLRAFLVSLEERGLKSNSVATRHSGLRALYAFMVDDEIILSNPMKSVPTPAITDERVPPALTPEQVDAMVKSCRAKSTFIGARDRALILLISSSGIRSGEALGLREKHLHLDREQPYVTVVHGKGAKDREAAVSLIAARALLTYLRARRKRADAHRPDLWLSHVGRPLTSSGLLQIVREAGQRAGLGFPVHVHALRHTAVHGMLARGMGEHDVMVQAGWTSSKQLARYGAARAVERSRSAFFATDES